MSDRQRLLYILAPSYSGSTLLTYLLSLHPDIATIGELKATPLGNVDEYVCSCGRRIVECDFWASVAAECRKDGMNFDVHSFDTVIEADKGPLARRLLRADVRGPLLETVRAAGLRLHPGARKALATRIDRNYTLARAILRLQGGRIFLDGSKDAARLLHFVHSGRWDVSVINLSRDGRAVSASIARHLNLPFNDAAAVWARNMRGLKNMRARLDPSRVFDLRYEDFCDQPEDKLSALFDWLELPPTPIETTDFRQVESHILGNAMRLSGVSMIRLDEKWRERLTPPDIEWFGRNFGAVNASLGYE